MQQQQSRHKLASPVQAEAAAAEAAQTDAANRGIRDMSVSQETQPASSGPLSLLVLDSHSLVDLKLLTLHACGTGCSVVQLSCYLLLTPRLCADYLLDNLDSWADFSQPPRLFAIPPKPTLIAMRPFLLDTAQGFVTAPSLDHRLSAKQKPGMVASLFGWRK